MNTLLFMHAEGVMIYNGVAVDDMQPAVDDIQCGALMIYTPRA